MDPDTPPPWLRLGLLGFASGLPLYLTNQTLLAWMTQAGVPLATVGLFSLVGLPYTLKFLWSPLVDRFPLPPGRRRGWILAGQGACVAAVLLLAVQDPHRHTLLVAGLALGAAFASATVDIALDAWRTEVVPARWQGLGTSVHVTGYRIGMMVAGAGALILADRVGWRVAYLVMGGLLLLGLGAVARAPEVPGAAPPRTPRDAVVGPLGSLLGRRRSLEILAFVLVYKLGDALGLGLVNPFLIQKGYSLTAIGVATKGVGLAALLAGSFLGGALLRTWALPRALVVFGVAQALPCLALAWLAGQGGGSGAMVVVICLENLGYGLGMVGLTTLLMRLCEPGQAATQFALLSSLAAFGRVVGAAPAGLLAERLGWPAFFLACFALAAPGLWLARRAGAWAVDPPG